MPQVVYLANDPQQILYDKKSIPEDVSVIEPDVRTLLVILEKQLKLLGVEDFDWLYCTISMELPIIMPVFYPKDKTITNLYEKAQLIEWFNKIPKHDADPGGLSEQVTIDDYIEPTAEQILDFVFKSSKLEPEFLIYQYVPQVNECRLEQNPRDSNTIILEDSTSNNLLIEVISSEEDQLLSSVGPGTGLKANTFPSTPKESCVALFLYSLFSCNRPRRKPSQEQSESNGLNFN